MPLVMKTEVQPSGIHVRAIRCFYYGAMIVGLPLWLLVGGILVLWGCWVLWPPPDIGPDEVVPTSMAHATVMRAACMAFFVSYPTAFLWAYRVTRHPWMVFTAMLVPVLGIYYALSDIPINDSNAEERASLIYLGFLVFILAAGVVTSAIGARVQPPQGASA